MQLKATLVHIFDQGGLCAGSDPLPTLEPVLCSRPGKLAPEWHQHFAGLEQRTADITGWGRSNPDQGSNKTAHDHRFLKKNRATVACSD